jgi:hypothetical protein
LKWAWGENDGPQDRPGALIDHAQPRDLLATGQRQLLAGIHLPDLVRLPGPARGRGRRAAGTAGRRSRPPEPAQHGAFAGQRLQGEESPQLDAQAAGPPAGVLAAEAEGGLAQRGVRGVLALAAGVVSGPQGGLAQAAAAGEQLDDGAGGQGECAGDVGRGGAALVAAEDGLAEGEGQGTWHGTLPQEGQRAEGVGHISGPARNDKTWCRVFPT